MTQTKDVPLPKTPPGEKETSRGLLDYLRDRVVAELDGPGEPEIRTAGVDSGTNLLGLVKHWRLAHMLEETGRHAGQMDITRERIDGRTGR